MVSHDRRHEKIVERNCILDAENANKLKLHNAYLLHCARKTE